MIECTVIDQKADLTISDGDPVRISIKSAAGIVVGETTLIAGKDEFVRSRVWPAEYDRVLRARRNSDANH